MFCVHERQALALIGEFNNWDPKSEHWAIKNDFGVWQLFLPDKADGTPAIEHRCGGGVGRKRALLFYLSLRAAAGMARCCAVGPDPLGVCLASRRTKVKVRLETAYGEWVERIPAWIRWATQVCVHAPLHLLIFAIVCWSRVHPRLNLLGHPGGG